MEPVGGFEKGLVVDATILGYAQLEIQENLAPILLLVEINVNPWDEAIEVSQVVIYKFYEATFPDQKNIINISFIEDTIR